MHKSARNENQKAITRPRRDAATGYASYTIRNPDIAHRPALRMGNEYGRAYLVKQSGVSI